MNCPNKDTVDKYVNSVLDGSKIACPELIQTCQRYRKNLQNQNYEFRSYDPEYVIMVIERLFVHEQGQRLDGSPLMNQPFLLEPWQKCVIYDLLGFYKKGTFVRKYTEAFIMVPRKNGKTPFITAFAFGYALLERASGSKAFIVASNLRDAMQSFRFLKHNVSSYRWGDPKEWRVLDNNQSHSVEKKMSDGSIYFEAMIARDSIVGNLCILDELWEYKTSQTYDRMKKSGKAYTNKLTLGITTAGDNMNSFCYQHMRYCQKILDPKSKVEDEQMYVFITKAIEDEDGYVDYTDVRLHEMANPNYGVTIRPEDMIAAAYQAQEKPISRKEFLSKELNIYTSSIKTYFDTKKFMASDDQYNWGYKKPIIINYNELVNYKELVDLNITWYGGADLSKMHDLTASVLYGEYEDVAIIITHAFYPRTRANEMAEKSGIPYFGWEEEGWLTFSNQDVVDYDEVAQWFIEMREFGFNIAEIGFDRQMAREFVILMEGHDFKMVDVPQKYWIKSEGFRRIELKSEKKKLYYLHSSAYIYCVENVKAQETSERRVRYEKTSEDEKIDLFDASVFGAIRYIENMGESEWEV